MRMLAVSVGLEVEIVRSLTHSEWFYYQLMHLVGLPTCGASHPFWAGKGIAGGKARIGLRLIASLRRLRVHQIISRALDALGVGDNQLFTLRKPDRKGLAT